MAHIFGEIENVDIHQEMMIGHSQNGYWIKEFVSQIDAYFNGVKRYSSPSNYRFEFCLYFEVL